MLTRIESRKAEHNRSVEGDGRKTGRVRKEMGDKSLQRGAFLDKDSELNVRHHKVLDMLRTTTDVLNNYNNPIQL